MKNQPRRTKTADYRVGYFLVLVPYCLDTVVGGGGGEARVHKLRCTVKTHSAVGCKSKIINVHGSRNVVVDYRQASQRARRVSELW